MIEQELVFENPFARLERNAEHQRYFLSDGSEVAGASTIAKMGDDPGGIIYWAWDLGRQGKDYRKVLNELADAGHISHFKVDCHLNGLIPDLREFTEQEITLAQPSFDKFLEFWESEELTLIETEEQLVHEQLRYGGTIDLRARDKQGRHCLIDWKSSKKLYNSHKWQLGGYEELSNCNHPDDPIQRRAIIRIGRAVDDVFHAHWITDEAAQTNMRIFAAQANLYNTIRDSTKRRKARQVG